MTRFVGVCWILLGACVVQAADSNAELSFTRDVIPVLTKAGCNAGACHGAFQGRGGFRLSLLGFDPAADFESLTKEGRGRRVSIASPEQSLILRKAIGQVPHGGGARFPVSSSEHRILQEWITAQAPGPQPNEPTLMKLTVSPTDIVLPRQTQADLKVEATWSDGRVRTVGDWTLFDSQHSAIVEATPTGKLSAIAPGKTSVMARFGGHVAVATVSVPTGKTIAGDMPRHNEVDDFIQAEWSKVGLEPAPLCDDATFLRRVSLDLIGTLPTVAETTEFLASTDSQKRRHTIDRLLERPEYLDYWSWRWCDLLRIHRRSLGEKGLGSFQSWLRGSLRQNRPVDQMVRELLTAKGNLYSSGPVAYYFVDRTPHDLAETTAQVFLGVRLQCARCHHHPFELWSQDDYYGLAAYFGQVQRKDTRENGRFGGSQSLIVANGTVTHPTTGQVVVPRHLGQSVMKSVTMKSAATPSGADVRVELAQWITAPENPWFARNLVNRYWGSLFGRGLVEPIDDLRATNPPSHPALMDWLAKEFVDHHYDAKHVLRTLCNSRAYQLATELTPDRDLDGTFFTHRQPRRLPAEVMLDAINQVTGTNEAFASLPVGTRAIALPDSTVASYFLDVFGRSQRTTACECARMTKPDLSQALHLANSDLIHQKVTDPNGRLAKLIAAQTPESALIETLYLASLNRRPTPAEQATASRLVAAAPSTREGWEDLLWTLLNCAEFSFQH